MTSLSTNDHPFEGSVPIVLVLSDAPVLFIEVYSYDGFQDTLHTDMITH